MKFSYLVLCVALSLVIVPAFATEQAHVHKKGEKQHTHAEHDKECAAHDSKAKHQHKDNAKHDDCHKSDAHKGHKH